MPDFWANVQRVTYQSARNDVTFNATGKVDWGGAVTGAVSILSSCMNNVHLRTALKAIEPDIQKRLRPVGGVLIQVVYCATTILDGQRIFQSATAVSSGPDLQQTCKDWETLNKRNGTIYTPCPESWQREVEYLWVTEVASKPSRKR